MSAITTAPGASFVRASAKELLVVVLLGIEERDVEDVVDCRHRLESVTLDEVRPVLQPGIGDVRAPRVDLHGIVLERQDAAAEVAHPGREPNRRIPARSADLEHLAVRLRCHEGEQSLPRGSRNLPRALRRREAALALLGVLPLEPGEDGSNPVVEH